MNGGAGGITCSDVARGKRYGLPAMESSGERLRTWFQRIVSMIRCSLWTDFASDRCETKVTCLEVSSLLVGRAGVDIAKDFAGVLIWYVWNEFEAVGERANDEAIIAV